MAFELSISSVFLAAWFYPYVVSDGLTVGEEHDGLGNDVVIADVVVVEAVADDEAAASS